MYFFEESPYSSSRERRNLSLLDGKMNKMRDLDAGAFSCQYETGDSGLRGPSNYSAQTQTCHWAPSCTRARVNKSIQISIGFLTCYFVYDEYSEEQNISTETLA